MITPSGPRVRPGCITGLLDRGDAEKLQDQATTLLGCVVAEGRQLLLLGEHRGSKRRLVHAERGPDEPADLGRTIGHDLAASTHPSLDRCVDAAEAAPHQVVMTVVGEADLDGALVRDPRGSDVALGRA